MALKNIILLSEDTTAVDAVKVALDSNGQLSTRDVCRSMTEMKDRLKSVASPAVLIDIDANPHRTLAEMEPLVRQFPETRFVVLSESMRSDLVLEAMQIGARHYMLKNTIAADLSGVLHRLCPTGAESVVRGSAVTILSAGGGCGATTVAVNLAAEFDEAEVETKGTTLLVDLDPCYGAIATYLGIDSDYGMLDLLKRTGHIDSQLIQSTAVMYSDRIHALLSKGRARGSEPAVLDEDRLGLTIDSCKRVYNWTVVDAPRQTTAASVELAKRSCATVILMQLTIKDIRIARQLYNNLLASGISQDAIYLVANRYKKRGPLIKLEEAKVALGLKDSDTLRTLSNDFYGVSEAVNLGKPLNVAAPRSDFRRELKALCAAISAVRHQGGVAHRAMGAPAVLHGGAN